MFAYVCASSFEKRTKKTYRSFKPYVNKIQIQRAAKVFILIRPKGISIYICLQLSSSIACLVWKPAQFEVQSYNGASVTNRSDRVCSKI